MHDTFPFIERHSGCTVLAPAAPADWEFMIDADPIGEGLRYEFAPTNRSLFDLPRKIRGEKLRPVRLESPWLKLEPAILPYNFAWFGPTIQATETFFIPDQVHCWNLDVILVNPQRFVPDRDFSHERPLVYHGSGEFIRLHAVLTGTIWTFDKAVKRQVTHIKHAWDWVRVDLDEINLPHWALVAWEDYRERFLAWTRAEQAEKDAGRPPRTWSRLRYEKEQKAVKP